MLSSRRDAKGSISSRDRGSTGQDHSEAMSDRLRGYARETREQVDRMNRVKEQLEDAALAATVASAFTGPEMIAIAVVIGALATKVERAANELEKSADEAERKADATDRENNNRSGSPQSNNDDSDDVNDRGGRESGQFNDGGYAGPDSFDHIGNIA